MSYGGSGGGSKYGRKNKYGKNDKHDNSKNKNPLEKAIYEEPEAPRRVSRVEFGLLSGHDILKISELNVVNKNIYKLSREPAQNGQSVTSECNVFVCLVWCWVAVEWSGVEMVGS